MSLADTVIDTQPYGRTVVAATSNVGREGGDAGDAAVLDPAPPDPPLEGVATGVDIGDSAPAAQVASDGTTTPADDLTTRYQLALSSVNDTIDKGVKFGYSWQFERIVAQPIREQRDHIADAWRDATGRKDDAGRAVCADYMGKLAAYAQQKLLDANGQPRADLSNLDWQKMAPSLPSLPQVGVALAGAGALVLVVLGLAIYFAMRSSA